MKMDFYIRELITHIFAKDIGDTLQNGLSFIGNDLCCLFIQLCLQDFALTVRRVFVPLSGWSCQIEGFNVSKPSICTTRRHAKSNITGPESIVKISNKPKSDCSFLNHPSIVTWTGDWLFGEDGRSNWYRFFLILLTIAAFGV